MTAGPNLRIAAEVTRQIRQHARSSMTTEVCGVLIGDLLPADENGVQITASIAAVNAAQAGTHVTFTQDAWEHIYRVKDAEFPDARIVGWYHSHPGFGVFLSEHDTFIQENFFSAPTQVAWVFDPHTDEEGCFGWINGAIERLASVTVVDTDRPAIVSESRDLGATQRGEPDDADPSPAPRPAPSWLRWAAYTTALIAALGIGFAVSRILFPAVYPLVLPMNAATGQPVLRDGKSGEPVYMDLETKRYLVVDAKRGKLREVEPQDLRTVQTPPVGNPFAVPPPSSITTPPTNPKEKP